MDKYTNANFNSLNKLNCDSDMRLLTLYTACNINTVIIATKFLQLAKRGLKTKEEEKEEEKKLHLLDK